MSSDKMADLDIIINGLSTQPPPAAPASETTQVPLVLNNSKSTQALTWCKKQATSTPGLLLASFVLMLIVLAIARPAFLMKEGKTYQDKPQFQGVLAVVVALVFTAVIFGLTKLVEKKFKFS